MADQVKILVGTKKGAFVYTSDRARQHWELSPPMLTGWTVHHMAADTREASPRLFMAANHWAWGPSVAKSDDLGATWDYTSKGLGFPSDMGVALQNVWNVAPGHASEPEVVFAGTQPAGLFRSDDRGHTWTPVDGLNRQPSREHWGGTGGGDSCVNSVEIDPRDAKRMFAAVSAGGSYLTRDGGDTWEIFSLTAVAKNEKARKWMTQLASAFPEEASAAPEGVDPMAVDEMHKMHIDQKNPDRIWTQTHVGVFRSDDSGGKWDDVTDGLPSFHGFPIAITKRAPDAVYVVPLAFADFYDNFRVCDGQFAVYRTRDSGKTWESLTKGLPGPHDYQSVYREGLDTDGLESEGVYVGTSNGEVYASIDGGDAWSRLPGTLPPILSVTAAVV